MHDPPARREHDEQPSSVEASESETSFSTCRFRLPAEWEPHAATWVSWPHNRDTWPGKFDVIPKRFADMVRLIADFEPVCILAGGDAVAAEAERFVGDLANVTLFNIATNDAWCRDHGPMFVKPNDEKEPVVIDWEYNAWGGKYPPFDKDNAVPARVARVLRRRRITPEIVLEGGAVEGDGRGTIITTSSCLLNPNRNDGMTKDKMETILQRFVGAGRVLWLERGELAGDDTDGHIDQLARFINPQAVAVAWETNLDDVNYAPLAANHEQLSRFAEDEPERWRIVKLPLPQPKYQDGNRLPASYCNFYFVNGGVIVPQFEDPADEVAVKILQELCPDRKVVGAASLDLVWGLGSIHCLTQQQPL